MLFFITFRDIFALRLLSFFLQHCGYSFCLPYSHTRATLQIERECGVLRLMRDRSAAELDKKIRDLNFVRPTGMRNLLCPHVAISKAHSPVTFDSMQSSPNLPVSVPTLRGTFRHLSFLIFCIFAITHFEYVTRMETKERGTHFSFEDLRLVDFESPNVRDSCRTSA